MRWFLSIDVPVAVQETGQRTYRSIMVAGEEIQFSDGFTDLRARSYEKILADRGLGLEKNRVAIETVADVRNATPLGRVGSYHPFLDQFS